MGNWAIAKYMWRHDGTIENSAGCHRRHNRRPEWRQQCRQIWRTHFRPIGWAVLQSSWALLAATAPPAARIKRQTLLSGMRTAMPSLGVKLSGKSALRARQVSMGQASRSRHKYRSMPFVLHSCPGQVIQCHCIGDQDRIPLSRARCFCTVKTLYGSPLPCINTNSINCISGKDNHLPSRSRAAA